jgi:hypothetical protein
VDAVRSVFTGLYSLDNVSDYSTSSIYSTLKAVAWDGILPFQSLENIKKDLEFFHFGPKIVE